MCTSITIYDWLSMPAMVSSYIWLSFAGCSDCLLPTGIALVVGFVSCFSYFIVFHCIDSLPSVHSHCPSIYSSILHIVTDLVSDLTAGIFCGDDN